MKITKKTLKHLNTQAKTTAQNYVFTDWRKAKKNKKTKLTTNVRCCCLALLQNVNSATGDTRFVLFQKGNTS